MNSSSTSIISRDCPHQRRLDQPHGEIFSTSIFSGITTGPASLRLHHRPRYSRLDLLVFITLAAIKVRFPVARGPEVVSGAALLGEGATLKDVGITNATLISNLVFSSACGELGSTSPRVGRVKRRQRRQQSRASFAARSSSLSGCQEALASTYS
jgi:hypothetical protein